MLSCDHEAGRGLCFSVCDEVRSYQAGRYLIVHCRNPGEAWGVVILWPLKVRRGSWHGRLFCAFSCHQPECWEVADNFIRHVNIDAILPYPMFYRSPQFTQLCVRVFDRNSANSMKFDDFIQCCVMLKSLTDKFRSMDKTMTGVININYEQVGSMSCVNEDTFLILLLELSWGNVLWLKYF